MKNYEEIVKTLLELDIEKNISSIELQVEKGDYAEINIIHEDFDAIPDSIWTYTSSFMNTKIHIENFGMEENVPKAIKILYTK